MHSERPQRGFISISGIFSLLILALMIFVGFKLLPPYINNYQLQDSIQNLVLTATYSPVTDAELTRTVISRAGSYGIELQPKQVSVHKAMTTVVIVVDYTVTVDLLVRRFDIHFEPSASNKNIAAN